jgi:hypothetical protein
MRSSRRDERRSGMACAAARAAAADSVARRHGNGRPQRHDGGLHPIWGIFFPPADFSLILGWSPNNSAPAAGPTPENPASAPTTRRAPSRCRSGFLRDHDHAEQHLQRSAQDPDERRALVRSGQRQDPLPDVGIGGAMWTSHNAYGSYINPTPPPTASMSPSRLADCVSGCAAVLRS